MSHPDHEQNRVAWNEMADIHYAHPWYRVKEFLDGWCSLKEIELSEIGDVAGKSLLHLMCQFGMDSLSWARRGASVTGVDISDRSIELANKLKAEAGLEAEFIRTDLFNLAEKLKKKFDIVFQSYGTHHSISDLERWSEIVTHFLKPGGIFYIVDIHPILPALEEGDVSYFKRGPYRYSHGEDYADKDYIVKSELVEWQHKLSDIINAVIEAGLKIEMVNEFDKCCYQRFRGWVEKDGFYYPPDGPPRHPLMFSLKARKG
jgi:SAM-dependent methyltransferase